MRDPTPSRTWIPIATLALLAVGLGGCRKKPLYVGASIDSELRGIVTLTVGGRVLPDTETSSTTGTSWRPGEEPADLAVEVAYQTPCGKRTFTIQPGEVDEDSLERRRSVRISAKQIPGLTELWLDPGLEGSLSLGAIPVPTPLPKSMRIAFGDCPRTVKVATREVAIPVDSHPILVARDEGRCFLEGVVLFGSTSDGCKPESSTRLTGKPTYVMGAKPRYLFEGVPHSTTVFGRGRKCENDTFLQVCRGD